MEKLSFRIRFILSIAFFVVIINTKVKAAQIVQTSSIYTYDEMAMDMIELLNMYPSYISVSNIGTSVLGRGIPVIMLGNPEAPHRVLVTAAMHGREYESAQVVMRLVECYASSYSAGQLQEVANNTLFCVVPMVNPDGVTIAQSGAVTVVDPGYKDFINKTGHAAAWKCNANGVDINRNFNVLWNIVDQHGHVAPSYEMFKGYQPESEPETVAIRNYVANGGFSMCVNYHQAGNVIYAGSELAVPEVNQASLILAQTVSSVNRCPITKYSKGIPSYATFADYVCGVLGKPSTTIEVGTAYGPAGQKQVASIVKRNLGVFTAVNNLMN